MYQQASDKKKRKEIDTYQSTGYEREVENPFLTNRMGTTQSYATQNDQISDLSTAYEREVDNPYFSADGTSLNQQWRPNLAHKIQEYIGAGIGGIANAFTFGLDDELVALLGAGIDKFGNLIGSDLSEYSSQFYEYGETKKYLAQKHPWIFHGMDLFGKYKTLTSFLKNPSKAAEIVSMFYGGTKAGTDLTKRALVASGAGALEGAASGEGTEDRLSKALSGALLGGVAEGAAHVASPYIREGWDRIVSKLPLDKMPFGAREVVKEAERAQTVDELRELLRRDLSPTEQGLLVGDVTPQLAPSAVKRAKAKKTIRDVYDTAKLKTLETSPTLQQNIFQDTGLFYGRLTQKTPNVVSTFDTVSSALNKNAKSLVDEGILKNVPTHSYISQVYKNTGNPNLLNAHDLTEAIAADTKISSALYELALHPTAPNYKITDKKLLQKLDDVLNNKRYQQHMSNYRPVDKTEDTMEYWDDISHAMSNTIERSPKDSPIVADLAPLRASIKDALRQNSSLYATADKTFESLKMAETHLFDGRKLGRDILDNANIQGRLEIVRQEMQFLHKTGQIDDFAIQAFNSGLNTEVMTRLATIVDKHRFEQLQDVYGAFRGGLWDNMRAAFGEAPTNNIRDYIELMQKRSVIPSLMGSTTGVNVIQNEPQEALLRKILGVASKTVAALTLLSKSESVKDATAKLTLSPLKDKETQKLLLDEFKRLEAWQRMNAATFRAAASFANKEIFGQKTTY